VAGECRIAVVLVRDPNGQWRDEALLSTDPNWGDWDMVVGHCHRWSVAVAIGDAKGQMGFS
jgi:hypothetical protein